MKLHSTFVELDHHDAVLLGKPKMQILVTQVASTQIRVLCLFSYCEGVFLVFTAQTAIPFPTLTSGILVLLHMEEEVLSKDLTVTPGVSQDQRTVRGGLYISAQ